MITALLSPSRFRNTPAQPAKSRYDNTPLAVLCLDCCESPGVSSGLISLILIYSGGEVIRIFAERGENFDPVIRIRGGKTSPRVASTTASANTNQPPLPDSRSA